MPSTPMLSFRLWQDATSRYTVDHETQIHELNLAMKNAEHHISKRLQFVAHPPSNHQISNVLYDMRIDAAGKQVLRELTQLTKQVGLLMKNIPVDVGLELDENSAADLKKDPNPSPSLWERRLLREINIKFGAQRTRWECAYDEYTTQVIGRKR